ncbi:hypothetical protein H0H93_007040 [Arthromyces matolae]|nr:hypothetical protein H0H93_007040 [Arthromyces matolae]
MPPLSLNELLNPAPVNPAPVGITTSLEELKGLLAVTSETSPSPPTNVQSALKTVIEYLETKGTEHVPSVLDTPLPILSSLLQPTQPRLRQHVKLNRVTLLSRLYIFDNADALVEYPESAPENPVGYLFPHGIDSEREEWQDMAYSLGEPKGWTPKTERVTSYLLLDDKGEEVLCRKGHWTCQGAKICPKVDIVKATTPHSKATRQDISDRLKNDIENKLTTSSPARDVFEKTSGLISAYRKLGCQAPLQEPTYLSQSEKAMKRIEDERRVRMRRGYAPVKETCQGRLSFEYNDRQLPYVACEHYNNISSRNHYIHYLDESFDLEYLEAYINEDSEEMDRIEAISTHCPKEHRDDSGDLYRPELLTLPCNVKIHYYKPIDEHRSRCPWAVMTVKGIHNHPIPLPQKTPPPVKEELFRILIMLREDLPDLTARGLIRHPVLKAYLGSKFPDIHLPTLTDLHVSLANRSHLQTYIDFVKLELYPSGTGWKGLQLLKANDDEKLSLAQHYIRSMIEIAYTDEEVDDDNNNGAPLRIVVCMTPCASHRLLQAQYLQCDIGFKRVQGFQEFELASMDRVNNTSITFCRVFVTQQTALAHLRVFQEIESIVLKDTGQSLKWRHLHFDPLRPDETQGMILSLAVDQHGGQAKGIGLHLQGLAQNNELREKRDIHEPHRRISDLTPYEHLHRLLRLCTVHVFRNIRGCSVSEDVRNKMRSLVCIRHYDWEGTIRSIEEEGGKAGKDWVQDKFRSGFAFEAMCWAKSHIPIEIWRSGDSTSNVVESVHSDVNSEGVHCTLVGGVQKGRHFDQVKMNTLEAIESSGVRPSYQSGHISESVLRGIKRKYAAYHKRLEDEDRKIEVFNKKLKKAYDAVLKKAQDIQTKRQHYASTDPQVLKAEQAYEKAQLAYRKLADTSTSLPRGSGHVLASN